LPRLIEGGGFRSDLYYRVSAIPLCVPPLRERREDIPELARHLVERIAADLGRSRLELSEEAERALQAYPWPGNIRELRNVLERAGLLSERRLITSAELRFEPVGRARVDAVDTSLTLAELERLHIERVLQEENGRVAQAATRLGIPRSSLYQKIKAL